MNAEAAAWREMLPLVVRAARMRAPAFMLQDLITDAGLVFVESFRGGRNAVRDIEHYIWNEVKRTKLRVRYLKQALHDDARHMTYRMIDERPWLAGLMESLTPDGEAVVNAALSLCHGGQSVLSAKMDIAAALAGAGWGVRRIVKAFNEVELALLEV